MPTRPHTWYILSRFTKKPNRTYRSNFFWSIRNKLVTTTNQCEKMFGLGACEPGNVYISVTSSTRYSVKLRYSFPNASYSYANSMFTLHSLLLLHQLVYARICRNNSWSMEKMHSLRGGIYVCNWPLFATHVVLEIFICDGTMHEIFCIEGFHE